ncbi:MAG: hypothetical protein IRZ33_09690, partial [Alicyclobacillaceae bacterium]|nr:hypothetical protein [Alicyclobacillaceae bacterium]
MSNEAILARLQSLGVVLTEEEFLALTDTVEASEELVYHWFTDTELGRMGLEEDFPFFAAWVLWERLRPDKPCLAQFSEWMEEGYDWWGKDDMRAFTPWWTLWEGVKAWAARKQIRSVQDLDKQVGRYSTQFYQNWLNDLDDLLQNLSVRDLKYAQRRLEWARDASQQFAESDDLTLLNWGRAQGESLFRLGDPEAGDAVYRQLTERFPDDIWAYVGWGDEYSPDFAAAPAYVDPERALRIYRLALEHVEPGSVDEETIRERM